MRLPMIARIFLIMLLLVLVFSPVFANENGNDDEVAVSELADDVEESVSQIETDNEVEKEKVKVSKSQSSSVDAGSNEEETDDFDAELLQSSRRASSKSGLCRIIYLMYSRSEDILATLKEVFEADINAGSLSLTQNTGTNSIIVKLNESDNKIIDDVYDVIESLDFRTGQVLIDVLVVEMSITDDERLSAEWKDLIRNPLKTTNTLVNVGIDHGLINNDDPTAAAEGFKAFITSSNKMKLFLNALNKKGKVHVVSSPHIVTANHREAIFKIGEKLPLIESVRPAENGQITTFEIFEVGLELTVTPHINRAGEIDMEIHKMINAVMQDTYDAKQGTARMTTREANTNLTVNDNETIILGGFIEDKIDRAEHRIPLLSNIPIVGKVFTSVKKTVKKTELMVFITPKILKNREDVQTTTKTMVSRTHEKDKTMALLEMRKRVETMLKPDQQVIIDRRAHGWQYGFNTPEIDDLVWKVPQKLDPDSMDLPMKGTAPFGFGISKRLIPAPVRTYLQPSEGVVFKRTFEIEDPEQYRRIGLRVACDNSASVYINGVLVDEDPMMKMKDGHDFDYWNRERDDIPAGLLNKGVNNIVVLLGSDKDTSDAYFDMMLIGHKK